MDLTKLNEKTILSDEVFEEIFSQEDEIYKARLLLSAQEVAERFRVKGKFDQMVKAYRHVDREMKQKKKRFPEGSWQLCLRGLGFRKQLKNMYRQAGICPSGRLLKRLT